MSQRLLEIIPKYYDRLSPASKGILETSVYIAQNYGHPVVASVHLTVSILRHSSSIQLLSPYGIDTNVLAGRVESGFNVFDNAPSSIIRPAESYLKILSKTAAVTPETDAIDPPHLLAGTLLQRRLKGLAIHPRELQDKADRVSAVHLDSLKQTALDDPESSPHYAEIDPQLLIFLAAGLDITKIAELLKLNPQLCELRFKRLSVLGMIPREVLHEKAVDLRAAGLTNRQIAAEMELKASKVDQLLREVMAQNDDIRKRLPRRTPEEVEKIKQEMIRLKNDPRNLELKEIAAILGVPVTNISGYVTNLIKEGKITAREPRRVSDEVLNEFMQLRQAGLKDLEIAKKMGISKFQVRYYAEYLIKMGKIKSKKPKKPSTE